MGTRSKRRILTINTMICNLAFMFFFYYYLFFVLFACYTRKVRNCNWCDIDYWLDFLIDFFRENNFVELTNFYVFFFFFHIKWWTFICNFFLSKQFSNVTYCSSFFNQKSKYEKTTSTRASFWAVGLIVW